MATAAEPTLDDHLWTIAVARIVLGPAMNIQAPPNLQPEGLAQLIGAGINDWGGVSPVTPDHVNPEAPWPHLRDLEQATERAGRTLVERLAIYPEYSPVIPEFRASEISGTQGNKRPARKAAGSRLSALSRSGRDDKWLAPALRTPRYACRHGRSRARGQLVARCR